MKEEALDHNLRRTCIGTDDVPVARQSTEWMNEQMSEYPYLVELK